MQENIKALLASKQVNKQFADAVADLKSQYASKDSVLGRLKSIVKSSSRNLSKNAAELALLLLNELAEYKEPNWYYDIMIPQNSRRYYRIRELLGEKEFDNEDNYKLLVYFLGEQKAIYAKKAWEHIRFQIYQTGVSRRSFRSPGHRETYLINQINFLAAVIRQCYEFTHDYSDGYKTVYTYYDLSISEQIRYAHDLGDHNTSLFMLWSAAIDANEKEAYRVAEDIIFNKDETGKVTRSLIKALLNSEKKECWILVEKLLIAAQRQEGLRQTIVEAMDETSIGALQHMLKVIIDNDLIRFSSVVRALSVWAGLGWETARESTVKKFIEKGYEYLGNIDKIPAAIKSENNTDVYMALWAQGVYDIEKTIPYLHDLYTNGNAEKRTLALLFAAAAQQDNVNIPLNYIAVSDTDLAPFTIAVSQLDQSLWLPKNDEYYEKYYPGLFDALHEGFKRFPVKEKTFESYVFAWLNFKFERKQVLHAMLPLVNSTERFQVILQYFDDMDSTVKRQLSMKILPDHTGYGNKKKGGPISNFQREYALLILKDRSEFEVAYSAMLEVQLSKEEASIFPELLKRKSAGFRSNIIALILNQADKIIEPVISSTINGDPEQRLAALDILLQLQKTKRLSAASNEWISSFRNRKNISQKEEILLSQLSGENTQGDLTIENGYGFYDPRKMSPVVRPRIDINSVYEKMIAKHEYGFSMPFAAIMKELEKLAQIYTQHVDYEYESENWNNSSEKILLANSFRPIKREGNFKSEREEFENYPLFEIWEKWYLQSGLQPSDLHILNLAQSNYHKVKLLPAATDVIPEAFRRKWTYQSPLSGLVSALTLIAPYTEADDYLLGLVTRLFATLDEKELAHKSDPNWYGQFSGWQQLESNQFFLRYFNVQSLTHEQLKAWWQLFHWRQLSGIPEAIYSSYPPLELFCLAFKHGIINEDEMNFGIMNPEALMQLSAPKNRHNHVSFYDQYDFLRPMYEKVVNYILDIELKRGDSDTPLTSLASRIQVIYGLQRFSEILAGLGKTSLYRGYYFYYGAEGKNKQELFSMLLKHCFPLPGDTQQNFDAEMNRIKAKEGRLIEAAVYAPQWQKFISAYLGKPALDSAIWWMHAHTKTDAYTSMNAEVESEVVKYSSIDVEEFKSGAVDKEWFWNAYNTVGADDWQQVYDAAKFVSDGNGHRRARIYSDVLLGNLKLKEIIEKIESKRDQDYVRVFGLAPFEKDKVELQVLDRYEFLQKFKKGSKQFGAQRQTSEGVAYRVAMDNFSRNAGYPDPMRLVWAMEALQADEIFSKQTQVQYDDVLVKLIIDEAGQADVLAYKNEKELKSLPAALKKDVKVAELLEFRKTLREQLKRGRSGLEEAMNRGDIFSLDELKKLFDHPVISKHLAKLLFVAERENAFLSTGFFTHHGLKNADGTDWSFDPGSRYRVAHPVDLFHSGQWPAFQRLAFDQKLEQPFKQIFRELYLPTADELQEKNVSRRYAGHQVQPKQTAALLRSRGWKADYDEGLQKAYHKEGFVAKIFAMADWFSPAEVESPTLETVVFQDLKSFKNIEFTKINERIFSEVMRDLDLVVSVAHAGGVDPEASHSTIEMRAALLRETVRLFKLKNVEIMGSHAKIKGTLGDYSVHLGSAVAHKMAAGYLSIIPVHSQHRGRLFLPFVDHDPKSAEMISKVLLLARDKEIQDPTILSQISGA